MRKRKKKCSTIFVSLDMMFTSWPVDVSPFAVEVRTKALR